MRKSRRTGLPANLGIALVSASVVYLLIEFLIFPLVLPWVPLNRQGDLHEGIRALAQSSKSATVPRDYVAILGDSYAQGAGDWFLTVDHARNPPYNVTHLLHESTGRDVVTFGASGAGSLRGIVAEPLSQHEFVNAAWRFSLDAPDVFVAYFYEGNDLSDNLQDLSLRYDRPDGAGGDALDPAAFREFIGRTIVRGDPLSAAAAEFHWYDNLFFADFLYRAARRTAGRIVRGEEAYAPPPPEWHAGPVNRAIVGGDTMNIPDVMQGPALELTDDEIALAVEVFEQALLYLRDRFPDSQTIVVYIPSPLSCYELSSPTVSCQTYLGRGSIYPAALVSERSDAIVARVRAVARRNGLAFLDGRETMRRVSVREPVHGPLDWKHLNRTGIEALADELTGVLADRGVGAAH